MPHFSICTPARLCKENNIFVTLDIAVDIENDKIELVSEGTKDVIRLDLLGTVTLEKTLHEIVSSVHFQSAVKEKLAEHESRCNTTNNSAP